MSIEKAMRELAGAMALAEAYRMADRSHCRYCGLPATVYHEKLWPNESGHVYHTGEVNTCDQCKPTLTAEQNPDGKSYYGPPRDRHAAIAVRRLMRIAKGEQ